MRELHSVVQLYSFKRKVIKIKPPDDYAEKLRHFEEPDSSFSSYFLLAVLTEVQIVLIKSFWLHVPLYCQLDAVVVNLLKWILHSQKQVLERLLSLRFVTTLLAMGVVDHLPFVEVPQEMSLVIGLFCLFLVSQRFLKSLEENPIELLDVLLHLSILILPLEAFDEFLRGDFPWEL